MPQTISLFPTASAGVGSATLGAGTDAVQAVQTMDTDTSYIYAPSRGGLKANNYAVDGNMIPYNATITSIVVNAWCAAGTGTTTGLTVDLGVRIGGTTYLSGSPQSVTSQTYGLVQMTFALNPATSSAWTKYNIDALEIVVSLNGGTGTALLKCTQLYVDVQYEPTTDALMFGS